MGLRLHPREQIVGHARADLADAVFGWRRNHTDLTQAETISMLADVLGTSITGITKYAIREERHGDPDKPGGLE